MNVLKYTKEVEAVYFDGITDVQEIAAWCGGLIVELVSFDGRLRNDLYAIDLPSPGGYMTAGADFYIFKDGNSFSALQKDVFLANFEQSEP